jgi:hypothetical protein
MGATKHGYLITAYKDLAALEELVDELGADAVIYVHLDRRSTFPAADLQHLRSRPEVRYLSRRYSVRWGSRSHLLAMIDLARKAVNDGLADRLHLISGSDRPVWSQERMKTFFDADPQAEYLLHFPLPTTFWKDGGLDRLSYYHPLDMLDLRRPKHRRLRDLLLVAQRKAGIRRSLKGLPPLFGGSSWWSLTTACVAEVLRHSDARPEFLRRLWMTHVPEEVFFPTLVMASPFAQHVVNDHLRYMDWTPRNGNNPAVLDMGDAERIERSGKLFARKLDHPVSTTLMAHLSDRRKGPDPMN